MSHHTQPPTHLQIPFAFFVVGGVVSVVVGPLADTFNRKHLYVLTCLVGTIPCLLTYWCALPWLAGIQGRVHKENKINQTSSLTQSTTRVKTFEQFFFLRTLTGVAVGGAFPLIYSLASDITTPKQRALASSMITISMGMGGMLGQGVAGARVRACVRACVFSLRLSVCGQNIHKAR